ncbi:MAG UNVERIFIED_CONTAM: hypothetical protein LVR29_00400 [Microcystis novacekii LVE1205-3]|jgi:hypothetical protein
MRKLLLNSWRILGTFADVERLPNRWISAEKRYEVVPGKVTGNEVLQALKQILSGEQTKNQEVLISLFRTRVSPDQSHR